MDFIGTALAALVALSQAPVGPSSLEKAGNGALFFTELRAHLQDGYTVVGLAQHPEAVEVVLAGRQSVALVAEVDRQGNVTGTKVRVLDEPMFAPASIVPMGPESVDEMPRLRQIRIREGRDGPVLDLGRNGEWDLRLEIGTANADLEACGG